jgi:hypothetical protein
MARSPSGSNGASTVKIDIRAWQREILFILPSVSDFPMTFTPKAFTP